MHFAMSVFEIEIAYFVRVEIDVSRRFQVLGHPSWEASGFDVSGGHATEWSTIKTEEDMIDSEVRR